MMLGTVRRTVIFMMLGQSGDSGNHDGSSQSDRQR